MNFIYNDGGREASGRKGNAGDCVVRSIAIACNLDYDEVYKELAEGMKALTGKKSARNGVNKTVYEPFLEKHGFVWQQAPKFDGRKARPHDLSGITIARQARHLVAVIDGVCHDIFDSSDKMVYGYYARS